MSVKWLNWAFTLPPDVRGPARLAATVLADCSDDSGQSWYPLEGYDEEHPGLCEKGAWSRSAAQRALKGLKDLGYLTVEVNGKYSYVKNGKEVRYPADRRPNLYQLHEVPVGRGPESDTPSEEDLPAERDPESDTPRGADIGFRGVPEMGPNPSQDPSTSPPTGEGAQLTRDDEGQEPAPHPGEDPAAISDIRAIQATTTMEDQPMNHQPTLDLSGKQDYGAQLGELFLELRDDGRNRDQFDQRDWSVFIAPFVDLLRVGAKQTGGIVEPELFDTWADRVTVTMRHRNRGGEEYWRATCTSPKVWKLEWRNGKNRAEGSRMEDDYRNAQLVAHHAEPKTKPVNDLLERLKAARDEQPDRGTVIETTATVAS